MEWSEYERQKRGDVMPKRLMATMVAPECEATPPHKVLVSDEYDSWGNPCPYCMHDEAWKRIFALEGAEEARKHRWHRLVPQKAAMKVTGWMYALGIISSRGHKWSAHCNGCLFDVSFRGKRPYILGWERWKWNCIFRGHHWPGEYIGFDCCGKCLPCPSCDSITNDHEDNCDL